MATRKDTLLCLIKCLYYGCYNYGMHIQCNYFIFLCFFFVFFLFVFSYYAFVYYSCTAHRMNHTVQVEGKNRNFQSDSHKSSETREVTYTYRYILVEI